jgi:hypothetical protein
MKALIDKGNFSGKHPFVYSITKSEWDEESKQLIKDGYCFSIDLTEEEYNFIKSIDESVEVLYNEVGETKFFF